MHNLQLTLLLLLPLLLGFVYTQDETNSRANSADRGLIPAQYSDKALYLSPIKQVKNRPSRAHITGLTVPHHLLAKDLIAQAFNFASGNRYRRILLFSPNHFDLGSTNVSICAKDLATVFGKIQTDITVVNQLRQLPFVQAEDFFYREHGIQAVLPFIKYYFPTAEIIVLTFNSNTTKKQLDLLLTELEKVVTPETLVVQSTDYSHYLTPAKARVNDRETLKILINGDAEKVFSLNQPAHLDSIASQYIQTSVQKRLLKSQFKLLAHKNSQDYTNQPVTVSTSYLVQAYIKAAAVTKTNSKMIFVGDIMLSRYVGDIMERKDDYHYPYSLIKNFLNNADLTFGNLEGPISERGEKFIKRYNFRSNPAAVTGLKEAGFDILSIANNHIWDFGREAFIDTLKYLKSAGIDPVGGGLNFQQAHAGVVKEINGTKIAFLSYTDLLPSSLSAQVRSAGISYLEIRQIRKDIEKIKTRADLIVVSFHWGQEYQPKQSPRQEMIAKQTIDAGASLVIGHHPHVVQEVAEYKGGWIAYSLGNFIFDQSFSKQTTRGLVLVVEINNKKIVKLEKRWIQINKDFQPFLIEAEAQQLKE